MGFTILIVSGQSFSDEFGARGEYEELAGMEREVIEFDGEVHILGLASNVELCLAYCTKLPINVSHDLRNIIAECSTRN